MVADISVRDSLEIDMTLQQVNMLHDEDRLRLADLPNSAKNNTLYKNPSAASGDVAVNQSNNFNSNSTKNLLR